MSRKVEYLILGLFFAVLPLFVSPKFYHTHADPKFLIAGFGILILSILAIKRKISFLLYPTIFFTIYLTGYFISFFSIYSFHRAFLFGGLTFGSSLFVLCFPAREKKGISIFLSILSICSIFPSIVVFLQGYGYKILDYLVWQYSPYTYGTFEYKCEVGQFFSIVIPISFGISLNVKNKILSAFFWTIFAISLSSTIIAHSRAGFWGGIGGISIVIIALSLLNYKKFTFRFNKITASLISVVIKSLIIFIFVFIALKSFEFKIGGFSKDLGEGVKTISADFTEKPSNYSDSLRYVRLSNSFEIFKDHPLGIGSGQFQIIYPAYKNSRYDDWEVKNDFFPDNPHNNLMEILVEGGIISFAGFISLIIYILYNLGRIALKKGNDYQIAIILLGSIISLLFDSFFSYPMDRPAPSLFFFSVIGLSLKLIEHSCREQKRGENFILKTSLITLGILASFFMIRASLATYFIQRSHNTESMTEKAKIIKIVEGLSPDYFPLMMEKITLLLPFSSEKILLELEKVFKSYPTHPGIMEKMIKIYTLERRFCEAEEMISKLEILWPDPKKINGLRDMLRVKKLK